MASNPFHDLYLSESIREEDLVELFSPIIVEHSAIMFEPGHVVLLGPQGTGKTMLLNLLRAETRIAYERSGKRFPAGAYKFIGAGINLRKCGALEFAQHLQKGMQESEIRELQLRFADFVNHLIVLDLIASLRAFKNSEVEGLCASIGIKGSISNLNQFAEFLARDSCWFGALDGVSTIDELSNKLNIRIAAYRRYINLNGNLPQEIADTKTVIGDPVLKTVQYLREADVLEETTNVFVRIDQYEQLTNLNYSGTSFGSGCQELIHKALAARDNRVSYRIGTRRNGWPQPPKIYLTSDSLELKRDFDLIDMEELFRRRENPRTWVFPKFARDIYTRRIQQSEYRTDPSSRELATALGSSLKPIDRAQLHYVRTAEKRAALVEANLQSISDVLSPEWRAYVKSLSQDNIVNAWLCCAWLRQKASKKNATLPSVPKDGELPWASQPYWQKERMHQALMQIASSNSQALVWSGEEDLFNLCGGQILIFLFLLQHIWDALLRDRRSDKGSPFTYPIDVEIQNQGIQEASIEWKSKQIEGPNARQRKRFVEQLGEHFYSTLTSDKSMSYPGQNGISLADADLDNNLELKKFLNEASGFGDIVSIPHTSKRKGEKRTKYYLSPILSPYFRIPAIHTKEPEYISTEDAMRWLGIEREKKSTLITQKQKDLWED